MIGARHDPRAWVKVANTVAERIASGEMAPGGPVSSKPDLAAELGVSQETVRRAFRELASEGMIVRIPGRRYIATAGSSALGLRACPASSLDSPPAAGRRPASCS
jgi:DNA-binding GntR family transcriptional regulator